VENHNKKRSRWALVIVNLAAMIVVAMGLCWLALTLLDVWTGHGVEIVVPDVKGMKYAEAADKLNTEGFTVEIADSVYNSKVGPGVVVDQNPHRDTRVKPGRIVYITINAFTPKSVTMPRLTDMSARQAKVILQGLGIKSIREDTVLSEFKDLVLGARYNGRRLMPGARVPVTASITLEVGRGWNEEDLMADTVAQATRPEEPAERLDLY